MGGGGTETEIGGDGVGMVEAEGVGKSEEGKEEGGGNFGEEWR